MRVLLLGGYGQLGSALRDVGGEHEIIAPQRAELDIADREGLLARTRDAQPELIINAAGYTRVDDVESNAGDALAVNFRGAAHVAEAAQNVDAALLYISTDYVFAGDKGAPYEPEDEPRPLSVYGVSKLYGEFASAIVERHWVVRIAGLYGQPEPPRPPSNFVSTILRLARERGTMDIVTDQITAPSSARDVAAGLWELMAAAPAPGAYHLPQGGQCSWFEFASAIVELSGSGAEVRPTTSEALGRPAPRPPYSVLSGEQTWRAGVRPLRPWREALADYVAEIAGCGETEAGP